MSTQDDKDTIRRLFDEVSNRRDITAVRRFWTEDTVNHDGMPGQQPGVAGVEQGLAALFAAFPDYHEEVHRLVAEGDLVNAHVTVSGTHRGEFMGVPATGRRVSMPLMETFRLVDGRVAEMWVVADQLVMLQQLGVLPAPPDAGTRD